MIFSLEIRFSSVNWHRVGRRMFTESSPETSLTHHYLRIALLQHREDLLAPTFSTAFSDFLQRRDFSKVRGSGLRGLPLPATW